MKKIRYAMLVIGAVLMGLFLVTFINSNGHDYVESSQHAYEVAGMANGVDSRKFNRAISKFTTENHVSAIKAFTVPAVSDDGSGNQRFYVYGQSVRLPKKSLASREEFETSDVRTPIYFVGNISSNKIEKMFKDNGIKAQHLSDGWNGLIFRMFTLDYIGYLLALVLLILLIVLVLANIREQKKMNIKYLMGVSRFRDAFDSIVEDQKVFAPAFLIVVIVAFVYLWIQRFSNIVHISLYLTFLLYVAILVVELAAGCLRILMHTRYTVVSAIKGNTQSRLAFNVNFMIKTVVEILVCLSVFSAAGLLQSQRNSQHQLKVWQNHPTFYSEGLASLTVTTDAQGGVTSDPADAALSGIIKFGNYLEHKGGMFALYTGFGSEKFDYDTIRDGNVLLVNSKYLQQNRVEDSFGRKVGIRPYSKNVYVLVPSKAWSQRQRLIKAYNQELYLRSARKAGAAGGETIPLKIADNQRLFTYSQGAIDYGNLSGEVHSPTLVVISSEALGGADHPKIDANMNWDSYYSNGALLSSNLKVIKHGLNKFRLNQYTSGIYNVKGMAAQELTKINRQLQLNLMTIIVLLIVVLIEDVAFNGIYFNNHKRRIAIHRLFGYGFWKLYGKFIMLIVGGTMVEAGLVYWLTGSTKIVLSLLVISNVVEVFLLLIQNGQLNRQLASVIKED